MFLSEYYETNLIFCDIRNGYFRLTILSIYATFFKVSPLVQKQDSRPLFQELLHNEIFSKIIGDINTIQQQSNDHNTSTNVFYLKYCHHVVIIVVTFLGYQVTERSEMFWWECETIFP